MVDNKIAYVLIRNSTGQIVEAAGISFNIKDIEPNPIYKDEYHVCEVKINVN